VRDEHYALVGQALMWALEEACPQVMTPAVTRAWQAAYEMIAVTATAPAPEE
jgi:hemoglobin-like flavoprotein